MEDDRRENRGWMNGLEFILEVLLEGLVAIGEMLMTILASF